MKKKEEERVDESNCEFRLRFAEERERERKRYEKEAKVRTESGG